ncbi:tryptophan 7-halogenase [Salinimonas marina]|uniref:Tryptophan 7-halogenase n=1 Tax=Salinimonas marina TaxID=2785918 RepID=A0A7S9E0U2_9ALTE|nr:tryptophan 7-halogenase [Salinimonas marina]
MTTQRWQEIIDFLKLHYALNKRTDSRYWCDHRQPHSSPSSLRDNLTVWQTQPPWIYDSLAKHELFSAASQQYVLYGMGYATTQHTDAAQAMRLFENTERQAGKLLAGLPGLRTYLQ